jgi:hypothetical protein
MLSLGFYEAKRDRLFNEADPGLIASGYKIRSIKTASAPTTNRSQMVSRNPFLSRTKAADKVDGTES